MPDKIIRVAILGPESSGKSELCRQLATHFNSTWVPEYAREYLSKLNRKYTIDDIVKIISHQEKVEKANVGNANGILFTDTEYIIAKVWCEAVFGFVPAEIEEGILNQQYDLYLLTAADLPWIDDPLRENPGKGDFFFNWYEKLLKQFRFPYEIISGTGNERLQRAILSCEKLLNRKV